MPIRKSAANPRTWVWPWIWRWSIGTSPPAAIRKRLIIPVVAPSVSVRKSEPMMKCGEKGLAVGGAAAGGFGPRARRDVTHGGRSHVPQEVVEGEAVDRREPGERLVGAILAAAVSEAVALEHRARGREAPGHLADRHGRRHDAVRLGGAVGRFEIQKDFVES